MARTAHKGCDASVSTIGAPSHLWGTVDLDVVNNQVVSVQSLEFCIALCILQHLKKKLRRFLWPTTLRGTPLLGLSTPSNATSEATEWHTFLVCDYILQECNGTAQMHVLDRLGSLTRVLEVNAKV